MILYLDTSALIELYAEEPGTGEVRKAVEEARVVAVSEIGYVEARSALARREREGSFSTEEHDEAAEQLESDFREYYLLRPVSGATIARAGGLTRVHALRAYDAVHLAKALALPQERRGISPRRVTDEQASWEWEDELQVSLMSYDGALSQAARTEGLGYGLDERPWSGGG